MLRRTILIAITALATVGLATAPVRLNFDAKGKFKIAQFTDLHYDYKELKDEGEKTDTVQRAVLESENPDLVVFSGDAFSGTEMKDHDKAVETWSRVTAILVEQGYKWAMTFGNHDDDGPAIDKAELARRDMALNGSLTQTGPVDVYGITNYYLPIYASQKPIDGEVPAAILWLLDIQARNCEGVKGDGCVTRSQVAWFTSSSRNLTAKYGLSRPLFSLMFFHIPPPEFLDLWNKETCYGDKEEGVSCPQVNTGIVDAAYSEGTSAIFVGHDHKNDYCGSFKNRPQMSLCYGRKGGYGYYNPHGAMLHGSRIIEMTLQADGHVSWDTWIRDLEKKKIIQAKHTPTGSDSDKCEM